MKTLIMLVLSGTSILGAATGLQVETTQVTNEVTGAITTMEVFIQEGQTNLLHRTASLGDNLESHTYKFYHEGVLVGQYLILPDSTVFTGPAGSPYSAVFMNVPSQKVSCLYVSTTNLVIVGGFMATNGVFRPMDSGELRAANKSTEPMRKIMQDAAR